MVTDQVEYKTTGNNLITWRIQYVCSTAIKRYQRCVMSPFYSVFISHIYRQKKSLELFTFTFSFGLSGKQFKILFVYKLISVGFFFTRVQLTKTTWLQADVSCYSTRRPKVKLLTPASQQDLITCDRGNFPLHNQSTQNYKCYVRTFSSLSI